MGFSHSNEFVDCKYLSIIWGRKRTKIMLDIYYLTTSAFPIYVDQRDFLVFVWRFACVLIEMAKLLERCSESHFRLIKSTINYVIGWKFHLNNIANLQNIIASKRNSNDQRTRMWLAIGYRFLYSDRSKSFFFSKKSFKGWWRIFMEKSLKTNLSESIVAWVVFFSYTFKRNPVFFYFFKVVIDKVIAKPQCEYKLKINRYFTIEMLALRL